MISCSSYHFWVVSDDFPIYQQVIVVRHILLGESLWIFDLHEVDNNQGAGVLKTLVITHLWLSMLRFNWTRYRDMVGTTIPLTIKLRISVRYNLVETRLPLVVKLFLCHSCSH